MNTLYDNKMNLEPIKTFTQLFEETQANVSSGIATNPKPLTPIQKRKMLDEGELDIPNLETSKNKMRHGLPQITNFEEFVKAIKDNGGDITDTELSPDTLIPTQKNFNSEKVKDIVEKEKEGYPIIVSEDDYVVDGHHRWLAMHHTNKKIKCRKVSMALDDILELCKDASFVTKKTINENEDI